MPSSAAQSAALRRSQNGWPASVRPDEIGVKRYVVKVQGGTLTIPLATATAEPLIEMIEWWDQNIEPVKVIHGHNYREIRGHEGEAKPLSNHASGTGVDINPDLHPLESGKGTGVSAEGKKAVGTVPASKVPALLAKAKELGLQWGGSYKGRKDEMHFDFVPGPEKIAKTNSHYVPPPAPPFYKNPWFWGIAGTSVAVLGAVAFAVSRSHAKNNPDAAKPAAPPDPWYYDRMFTVSRG